MTDHPKENPRPRLLSGMRPTGQLHLGNYVGALQGWVKLQETYDGFFFVADWHALTTDYDNTARLSDNSLEVMLDFVAAGLDPEKSTLFVQSHVLQHAELHVLFSMITPLGWLERVPSFKEQQQNLPGKDLHMYGFLGYPLLQAADILLYRPAFVPVGEDQAAHVELTREVARRFNSFYSLKGKPIFPEPGLLLTPTPKLLGTDKRKMSKSYGNSILLSDEAAVVEEKIKNSVTDRPKLTDHGDPDRCPVGNLHQIFSGPERLAHITQGCTQATITCVECKALAVPSVNAHLSPIRERRRDLAQHPGRLIEIMKHGAAKATRAAEATMVEAREAVGLLRIGAVKDSAITAEPGGVLRVPSSAKEAANLQEWAQIITAAWVKGANAILKPDRPGIFITRNGRGSKVGVHAAAEKNKKWEFTLEDRPIQTLVLLAVDGERIHDYVLPPKFVSNVWKQFERDGASVRIRMIRSVAGALLELGNKQIPIQEYASAYLPLQ
ncbi:MAG TPA: tryptophan--tRNA ligase [Candidatus Angelobacter sp.]|nr:tryptophan--tRNA ligase [Candidatus Angelobacter sp.]